MNNVFLPFLFLREELLGVEAAAVSLGVSLPNCLLVGRVVTQREIILYKMTKDYGVRLDDPIRGKLPTARR